jgi:hypothetical protein
MLPAAALGIAHLSCAAKKLNRRGLIPDVLLANHRFTPLLTHTREIEQIGEAFAIASEYRDGVGKMIVRP